jgi:aminoglycoside 3-N-acetyltransferase I
MRAVSAMFGEAFEEPDTYAGHPPDDGYLARLLARDHVIALAALQDGVVAGGLFAYVLEKFEQAREEIFIYDLAVAAAHRRRGIAGALIEETRNIGAARGAHVMFIQAEPDNHPAVALYSKFGVREDACHFDIATDR